MPEMIKIKESALRLQGSIELAKDSQTDSKSQKISLLARTTVPFYHDWLGADLIHDFSTMIHAPKIALDYEHNTIIGYANQFVVDEAGLHLSGVLTGSNGTSQEVIQFLRDGIPLQASIATRDAEAEYVMPGATVNVNNQELTAGEYGLYVVRNWKLYACAVCKEGYDGRTETSMELSIKVKGAMKMSENVAVEEKANVEAEAVVTPAVEAELAVESEAKTEAVVSEEVVEAEVKAVEEPQELKLSASEVKAFVDTFGQDFALSAITEGKTFAEAQLSHYEAVKAENAELKKQVESLKLSAESAAPVVPFESSDKPDVSKLSAQERFSRFAKIADPKKR